MPNSNDTHSNEHASSFTASHGHRLIGARLGTCSIASIIGSGGMGTVYLAQQIRPSRTVAVKVLSSHATGQSPAENQEFLARFRREADVIAQLDHIHILPIYEYGEQDELAYLVMPYLTGGSLRDVLTQRGSLSPQEALTYIEQAATALHYAHRHKIVHRDIKPRNILFHSDGRLVLVDFGIAHIIRDESKTAEVSLTSTDEFLGSIEYMAPEMVNGRQIDHRTDIYELGIVLFEMLSGHVPFQGKTPFIIAAKHIHDLPPSLSELNPSISPQVDAVVRKALAKQPDERYTSAPELADALRHAITMVDSVAQSHKHYYTDTTLSSSHADLPAPSRNYPTHYPTPSSPLDYTTQEVATAETPAPPPPPGYTAPNNVASPALKQATHLPSAITPNQYTPRTASKSKRWIVTALFLCLLIGLSIAGFLFGPQLLASMEVKTHVSPTLPPTVMIPTPTSIPPTPTPTQTPSQQAQAIVQHYYDDINQKNYQDAYQLLGVDNQQQQPYNKFVQGYSGTEHDDLTSIHSILQTNGIYRVTITFTATQKSSTGTIMQSYTGYYIVGLENGQLKLLNGHNDPA